MDVPRKVLRGLGRIPAVVSFTSCSYVGMAYRLIYQALGQHASSFLIIVALFLANIFPATTTNSSLPVQMLNTSGTTLSGIVAISANGSFNLALSSSGQVYAWGLNGNGQLGDGTTTQRNEAVLVDSEVTAIVARYQHSVALIPSHGMDKHAVVQRSS